MDDSNRLRELIDRYLNGVAGAEDLQALNRLLETNPAAADQLLDAAELETIFERHFQEEPYRQEMHKTIARIRPHGQRAALWYVAASLLLVIGGLAFWQFNRSAIKPHEVVSGKVLVEGKPSDEIVEGAPVVVLGATPAVIQLADGSRAELQPESEAIVHGRQGANRQVVELRHGSGVFRVPKGGEQFRVDTAVGSVTCSDTEFSLDYRSANSEDDAETVADREEMPSSVTALVVSVATGNAQVDVQSQKFTLSKGESCVVAGTPSARKQEKKIPAPLPAGDLLGFEIKGKAFALERMFPGITAALLLSEDQRRQIYQAQQATVQSEVVRLANATIKSDPEIKAQQKAQIAELLSRTRKELVDKVAAILTDEQKGLVVQLNRTASEAHLAVGEQFREERVAAKGDQAKMQEIQQRMRGPLVEEFKSRSAKFLSREQMSAVEQAIEDQRAAEERAKNDPKNIKARQP